MLYLHARVLLTTPARTALLSSKGAHECPVLSQGRLAAAPGLWGAAEPLCVP